MCPCACSADWCPLGRADIEIQANEILHHKLTLNGYLAEFTGQSMEQITQARNVCSMPMCKYLLLGCTA